MNKRVFLIHGWDANPNNHWFPWLSLELKARGFEVNAPQMPNTANPKVNEWLGFLSDYVGKPGKETYFVGHSLGCIAIARYLAKLPGNTNYETDAKVRNTPSAFGISPSKEGEKKREETKVGGCVFVAGFSGRIDVPEISEFYSLPFDAEKAKAHCNKFVMIFSDNDPYVPMEKSLEFAQQLGAKTILERGKKHFSEGITSLPSALSALLKFSSLNAKR
ncbi:MAG TPA: alpha/beta hydrolase [Candidatus Paceibacterota bacterium]